MKKILNWTFGGFFRALGRVLCFIAIGTIIALIVANNDIKLPDVFSLGIMKVHAQELNYSFKQYRVQYYDLGQGTSAWTNYVNFNTATTISSGYGVSGIAVKFGYSSKFQAGTKYRVTIDIAWQPQDAVDYTAKNVDHTNCLGTLTTSNWSADASRIESCDYIGYTPVPNSTRIKYIYDIVPSVTVEGIQFNIYYNGTAEVSYIRVNTASTITTGDDISGAINEQNVIIQEEFNNITNIINENNQNLIDAITEQNQVCKDILIKRNTSGNTNGTLASNCSANSGGSSFLTDYLDLTIYSSVTTFRTGTSYCFYDSNKIAIGTKTGSGTSSTTLTIPTNARYIRFQVPNTNYEYGNVHSCKNSGQATNDLINDSDSSEATNEASSFFNNFTTNTHGLTSIVTAPLNAISSLTSSSCTALHLPIPYLDNKYIDLPCMRNIYDQNFGSFMTLYDTITFGIVSYWILVRIFALVKDFKNPEHDEIEVVDL